MELKDLFASPEAMKWLAMFAASLIIVLVTFLIGAISLKLTVKQAQMARYYLKEYGAVLREQVDEPDDVLPMAVDRILDGLFAANWNVFVSTLITALMDAILAKAEAPPREVNISEAVKT
jgi:hypothetical protein